jgi:hypothetical protein
MSRSSARVLVAGRAFHAPGALAVGLRPSLASLMFDQHLSRALLDKRIKAPTIEISVMALCSTR